jgi:hypothetical protein
MMSDRDFVRLWNYYCECKGNDDARVFMMYEFDSEMKYLSPSELVSYLDANFDIDDVFFKNGDYIESSSDIEDFVNYDELADYLLEHQGDDEWDLFFCKYEQDLLEQLLLEQFNALLIQQLKDAKMVTNIEDFLKWYGEGIFPVRYAVEWDWSDIATRVLIEYNRYENENKML